MLTHIDLFAGIGGFSLGFERAGIDTLAHVEIDDRCQGVLRKHWVDHLIFSDVCEVGKHNLPRADIITFGSPCQDLSIAGKRKGFADGTRSNLFFEAARIIREIEPRYAVWENVPGALSSHNGGDFKSVIECLLDTSVPMPKSGRWASAGMVRTGQKEVAWRILDAQYFGVAQRRRRLFLIFCSGNGSPSSILFESEGVRWNPPARGKAGQGTTGETTPCIGGQHPHASITDDISPTLPEASGMGGGHTPIVATAIQANGDRDNPGISVSNDVAFTIPANPMSDRGQVVAYENHPADSRITETGDISQQLTSRMGTGGGNVPLVANTLAGGSSKAHSDMTSGQQDGNIVCTTLTASNDPSRSPQSQEITQQVEVVNRAGFGVRRLTPTECERLQGFPDGWTFGSDSTRYKQLGNAVAVPVAEWIGKKLVSQNA